MSQFKVCDACSLRRVKCDGVRPCGRCRAATLECTHVRPRLKPGPKGMRNKTRARLNARKHSHAQQVPNLQQTAVINDHAPFEDDQSTANDDAAKPDFGEQSAFHQGVPDSVQQRAWPFCMAEDALRAHLDIYHGNLYTVWPIVERDDLVQRLATDPPNIETYMLALSICAATSLQLQLEMAQRQCEAPQPKSMLVELENLRRITDHRNSPTLDQMSTSFFMHVAYIHIGQRTTSTLLLREAISLAHMLGLHKQEHYDGLPAPVVQDHLRKFWLLYITEKAHATQYDIPCILNIDASVPSLEEAAQPFNLSGFSHLCRMFRVHEKALSIRQHTSQSLRLLHDELKHIPIMTTCTDDLQRADLSITQQWLRLMLWKMAVSQTDMSAEPEGAIKSLLFPVGVAKELLAMISDISTETMEAHGPGVELKLFDIINSVADVKMCLPPDTSQSLAPGLQDHLVDLVSILQSFRGGKSDLLPLLNTRLADTGLDVTSIARIWEVASEAASETP